MSKEIRLIKKYPNRRLYDTAISGYITVADVKQMIIDFVEIQVVDAKTGEDLTRQVLLQILLEEEAGGSPILNNLMLCQFIRMYGQASQSIFAPFMEQNMKLFHDWQKVAQDQGSGNSAWFSNPFTDGLKQQNQQMLSWQQSLQQQTVKFWQDMGVMPKSHEK
ncbi:polyhydroxyalkanoate synthesis repressor PhaR [Vitreoscilla massiliensis]|uniref:Polyhydroxyalkanoate synthesis repressor PhaR n=1 Tax=Vitreoscilla massiliensis TaxID=1689272 RepID=A0ABY4E040_9NEIS|nr:polyhydroxyalkanoate synthesis repressor PhaR [Vitreoscilla massiliensis]UOO88922.1 polyhydroxyalkanoate synthesis repressor PhaR [Vitreoscilla massiliensis]